MFVIIFFSSNVKRMSGTQFISFALNTLTTSLFCYLIQCIGFIQPPHVKEDTQALLHKIHNLEKNILQLQQTIEDLEERFNHTHLQTSSNTEIVNKIDKFIDYNYDILE